MPELQLTGGLRLEHKLAALKCTKKNIQEAKYWDDINSTVYSKTSITIKRAICGQEHQQVKPAKQTQTNMDWRTDS